MNWTLFAICSALWIFFSEHYRWLGRFKNMEDLGMGAPPSFVKLSQTISNLSASNMLVFFATYGFKTSWLWASVFVIGGYLIAIIYIIASRTIHGTTLHKAGWIAMPALSVLVWFKAFAG